MTRSELAESLGIAVDGIRSHKLRSFLTLLGVVIGVTPVILVAAILEGLDRTVAGQLQALGPTTMMITRFPQGFDVFGREEIRQRKYLKPEYAQAIRESCPSVEYAAMIAVRDIFFGQTNEMRRGNEQVNAFFLRGVDSFLASTMPMFQVGRGRFISPFDLEHKRPVAVIGEAIADRVFRFTDPLGGQVRLNGLPFEVIGVMKKGASFGSTPSSDMFVFIPFTTFDKLYPEARELILVASVHDTAELRRAEDEIVTTLRRLRRVPHNKPNDFEVFLPEYASKMWDQVRTTLLLLTGAISSITLLVGGIGVMNIMLITVTERTSEIGLRKTAGARQSDIRAQFLLEAVLLTSAGGAVGVLCGAALSWAVRAAAGPILPAQVSWGWALIGVAIAAAVGLFFGFYPANRAAGLDPIACLRHE